MVKTQHCAKQMHNRGLTNSMVELVELFGYQVGDRVILDKKHIRELLEEINTVRKELIKMYEKGGVAVVTKNDSMLTAFALTQRMGKVKEKYRRAG